MHINIYVPVASKDRRDGPKPLFENFFFGFQRSFRAPGRHFLRILRFRSATFATKKTLTQKSTVASIKNGKMPTTFRKSKEIQWILQIFANFANFRKFCKFCKFYIICSKPEIDLNSSKFWILSKLCKFVNFAKFRFFDKK